jgi:hypothetical protein
LFHAEQLEIWRMLQDRVQCQLESLQERQYESVDFSVVAKYAGISSRRHLETQAFELNSSNGVKPIADASPAVPRPANPNAGNGFELPGLPLNAELSLASRLQEAEKISDLKLRGMYEAVVRYGWYFKELRGLKGASKKYRTPDLLKVQFPNLEVWGVLDRNDVADVAKGEFVPGRFSWSLVKRHNGLSGKDDRTLKNYRRALRAAHISF